MREFCIKHRQFNCGACQAEQRKVDHAKADEIIRKEKQELERKSKTRGLRL